MKKNIILLISLVLITIGFVSFYQLNKISSKVIVYYFFEEPFGEKCEKIKTYSNDVINNIFSKEEKNVKIEFKLVNYAKDKAIQQKYNINKKSLALVKIENKKEIKNKILTEAREIIDSEQDFKKYLVTEIQKF